MVSNLADQTILVTGSTSGIGLGIAKKLALHGCKVVINGRNARKLEVAKELLPEAFGVVADVSVPSEATRVVNQVLEHCGTLNGIVCNVGHSSSVNPGQEHFSEWQRVFSANMWSTTNIVEAAKPALVESQGSIVCISSICGIETIPHAPITYSVAKAALNAYIAGISRPLGALGIRINGIAPGNILFSGSVWEKKIEKDAETVHQMLDKEISLGTFGSIEDIANFAAFILSDQAKFATGEVFVIDGGQVRRF